MPATQEELKRSFDGRSWLPLLPAALTVAGIALFGVLNLGYSLFYNHLGVTPDAVGVNYVNALARSTILVVVVALAVALFSSRYLLRRMRGELNRQAEELAEELNRLELEIQRARDKSEAAEAALRELDQSASLDPKDALELAREAARDVAKESREIAREAAEKVAREEALARAREVAREPPPPDPVAARRHEFTRRLDALADGLSDKSSLTAEVDEARLTLTRPSLGVRLRRQLMFLRHAPMDTWAVLLATVLCLALIVWLPLVAIQRANAVRRGHSVGPVRVLGLTLLDISAEEASLRPSGTPGESPAIAAIGARALLYLGQSGGTFVLFDPQTDRAVLVPATDAVLQLRS